MFPIWINSVYWIVATVHKQIIITKIIICVKKPTDLRIVIRAGYIIESRLGWVLLCTWRDCPPPGHFFRKITCRKIEWICYVPASIANGWQSALVRSIPETFKSLGLSQQTAFCPQKAMLAGIVYQGLILNSQISKIYFDFTPNSIFTVSPSSISLLIISSEFKLL